AVDVDELLIEQLLKQAPVILSCRFDPESFKFAHSAQIVSVQDGEHWWDFPVHFLALGRCSRGRACSAFNGSAIELPSRIDLERRPFLVDREKQVVRCPLADFAVHANETADLL